MRQSETREAINVLLNTDSRTDEQNGELRELTAKMATAETEYRAALVAEGDGRPVLDHPHVGARPVLIRLGLADPHQHGARNRRGRRNVRGPDLSDPCVHVMVPPPVLRPPAERAGRGPQARPADPPARIPAVRRAGAARVAIARSGAGLCSRRGVWAVEL